MGRRRSSEAPERGVSGMRLNTCCVEHCLGVWSRTSARSWVEGEPAHRSEPRLRSRNHCLPSDQAFCQLVILVTCTQRGLGLSRTSAPMRGHSLHRPCVCVPTGRHGGGASQQNPGRGDIWILPHHSSRLPVRLRSGYALGELRSSVSRTVFQSSGTPWR